MSKLIKLAIFSSFLLISYPPYSIGDDTNFLMGTVGNECGNISIQALANKNSVFDSLTTNVNTNKGYYEARSGKKPDIIYGQVLCRVDISPSNCEVCIREAIASDCISNTVSTIWMNWCVLRYASTKFYGKVGGSATSSGRPNTTADVDPTVAAAGLSMMEDQVEPASKEKLRFSVAFGNFGGQAVYGISQCTRDLGRKECSDCLNSHLKISQTTIENRHEWVISGMGCRMWYNETRFLFNGTSVISSNAYSGSEVWATQMLMTMTVLIMMVIS